MSDDNYDNWRRRKSDEDFELFLIVTGIVAVLAAILLPIFYPVAAIIIAAECVVAFALSYGFMDIILSAPHSGTLATIAACFTLLVFLLSIYFVVSMVEFRLGKNVSYRIARTIWRVALSTFGCAWVVVHEKESMGLSNIAVFILPLLTGGLVLGASTVNALSLQRAWSDRV